MTYTDNHVSKDQQTLEATDSRIILGHLQDFLQAGDTVKNVRIWPEQVANTALISTLSSNHDITCFLFVIQIKVMRAFSNGGNLIS